MSKEEGFSIITVSEDDAEEIVIEAGIPSAISRDNEIESGDLVGQDEQETAEGGEQEIVEDVAASRSEYQPTTAEDLETVGPFPRMRLFILLGGVLLFVGVVVYFAFLR